MATGLVLAFFATCGPLAFFLVPGISALDSTAFLAVIAVLGAFVALSVATLAASPSALCASIPWSPCDMSSVSIRCP